MAEGDRVEVRNAADPAQVQGAARRGQSRDRRYLDALRQVMSTPAGRFVFGDRRLGILAQCGIYEAIWRPNSEMGRLAARHDLGVEITARLLQAGEDNYELMEREARAIARRDNGETDAAHTPPAEQQG
jgi:hypothetical protein